MGMKIDGIAASQAFDTSAESINVKGLDISSLQAKQGIFNYEHRHPDPKDKDKTPSGPQDLLGAILFAKKIFGPEDCDDDRQLRYWSQVELPFLYIRGELYDTDGHDAARAMAAVIRFYHRNKIPCVVRFSIDGHTLERDGQELTHCVARDVALTIKPANHSCISGVISDSRAKSYITPEESRHNENGTERLPGVEFSMQPFDDEESSESEESSSTIVASELLRSELDGLIDLQKAMTAGSYNQAPGSLSGGAALSKEHVGGVMKNRLRAAIRDWDRKTPLKEHLTKTMDDVHPEFLEKFVDVLESKVLSKATELHGMLSKAVLRGPAFEQAIAQLPHFTENADKEARRDSTSAATKHLGKPGGPKPVGMPPTAPVTTQEHHDDEETQTGPEDRRKAMASVNQDAAKNSPDAAAVQTGPQALPPPPPHVPGLRIGLTPDQAKAKDAEAITAQTAQPQPLALGQPRAQPPVQPQPQAQPPAPTGRPAIPGLLRRTVAAKFTQQQQATKSEELIKDDAAKKPKPAAKPAEKVPTQGKVATPAQPAVAKPVMSIRGTPVQPNPSAPAPFFDEDAGVLRTERGDFPMYIPSRDSKESGDAFNQIMNAPKVNAFHNYAMKNWQKVNELIKQGRMPAGIISHATLFSQLSPNTPVPMQELMYGHLVDHMRDNGVEPQDPNFGHDKHFTDWMGRNDPQKYPQTSPEHWKRLDSQLRIKSKETATGRKRGDIAAFQLASNKWENMARYHEIHDKLVDKVNSNKDDVRKTARELMEEKSQGAGVPGLAPKTARYTLGMLGGGNVLVPDTHFVRHIFGLDKKLDGPTVDYLKTVMWRDNPDGAKTLEGMDRYYAKHHDAVKHMLEHPVHGKMFEGNPESAIFPAFWKHWTGIVPHERARGMTASGNNELTDHRVFWDSIQPFLTKKAEAVEGAIEDPVMSLARKTAMLHARWADQYGENPAMMMYYAYLVPHLMATQDAQPSAPPVTPGAIPVTKAEGETAAPVDQPKPFPELWKKPGWGNVQAEPKTIKFDGQRVKPGVLKYRDGIGHQLAGQELHLLGQTPEHYVVMTPRAFDNGAGLRANNGSVPFMNIPKAAEHKAFDVLAHAVPVSENHTVSDQHVAFPSRAHADLVRGLDMHHEAERDFTTRGIHASRGNAPAFMDGPQGKVFVKPGTDKVDDLWHNLDSAHIEAAFHNMAPAFGLGDVVPKTAAFTHPETGLKYSAQQVVEGRHPLATSDNEDLGRWHDSGLMPKMAVMDFVLGNNDRHDFNYLIRNDGNPALIDHGRAFRYDGFQMPGYAENNDIGEFDDRAKAYINSLNAEQIGEAVAAQGLPPRVSNAAADRVHALQRRVASGIPMRYSSLRSLK